jgi:hypothetical protein
MLDLNGGLKWILKRRELNANSMQNMSGLTYVITIGLMDALL